MPRHRGKMVELLGTFQSKQARHRSTNMLRHMSDIMFDFFEDLPTYLPTYRPTIPVLYASLLRRSIKIIPYSLSASIFFFTNTELLKSQGAQLAEYS